MKNSPNDPYITQSMLDQRLEIFAEDLSRRIIDEISEVLKDFFAHVDKRFNRLEAKVDAMGFANQARDAQLTRHERWHYQTADKLGLTFNPEI